MNPFVNFCKIIFHRVTTSFVIVSKTDPDILSRVIGNMSVFLQDENVNLVKKVMLSMTQLYKVVLQVGLKLASTCCHIFI